VAKLSREDVELNMTPMIDVVFQLIIFFVVTLRMEKEYNREIRLEKSPHGPAIKADEQRTTMVIEVDKGGRLSLHGARVPIDMLQGIIQRRFNKYGAFPILIRADKQTKHQDVRRVMDLCTGVGIWRINFAAIKEERTK